MAGMAPPFSWPNKAIFRTAIPTAIPQKGMAGMAVGMAPMEQKHTKPAEAGHVPKGATSNYACRCHPGSPE